MPSLLTRFRSGLERAGSLGRELFVAWRTEMESLFDETIGARLSRSATQAKLSATADELLLSVRTGRSWAELVRQPRPSDSVALVESLSAMSTALVPTVREIEIQWPDDRTLMRSMDLPNAARSRLKAAVELQLDRLTPFRPEDIYWTSHEQGPSDRSGQFRALLAVAPRREVDVWTSAFAAAGTRTVRVVTGHAPNTDNVLTQRKGRQAAHWATRAEWVLAGTFAGLVALTLGIAAWHQHVEQRLIDERLEVLRPQATKAEETRTALEQRLRQVAFLDQQFSNPDTAQLLSALNHDLPTDSWLFQLQQEGRTVTVTGFAKNASTIAASLVKEPLFANAQLRSATQQPGGGSERFDITVTLRQSPSPGGGAR